jgi:uncharacterized repeat protein (TIGR02543 family)
MNGNRRGSIRFGFQKIKANANRRRAFLPIAIVLAVFGIFSSLQAQTPIAAGYRDFYYGTTIFEAPTAEKPQSKLWWNDGYWWGSLWSPAANKYRIHRFNLAAQSWIDAGPDIDERTQTLADALWDGQKLYIASHVHNNSGTQSSGNTTPENSARLYRYSYNTATHTYSLDAGFPVLVNSATSETLVLDKDSTGQLWVTWTQANKVYVNRSQGDDLTWGTPFVMPTYGSNLSSDDISTLIAFNNKIGVVWSNQSDKKIYFAVHHDNNADTDWNAREIALEDPSLGAVVDDHLNIKLTSDGGGNLYLAAKTSLSGSSSPGIYLLKRSFGGGWSKYVVATNADDYTRPIVVIDDENRDLYVFGRSGNHINYKKVSLSNISFPSGAGTVFIESSGSVDINDATSSKHNLNSSTGLLILASCEVSFFYYHNYLALASNGPAPTISSFSPTSGPAGTAVTIAGNNFTGATGVAFNGAAASFTVNSNTQISATVPPAATTGKISVTKSNGTAFSAGDFTVTAPPQYTLTVNISGSGSVNPAGGSYDAGAMVTLTATPASGYQFSGWSGDLTGSTNPATITMNANKNVTATFLLSGGGGGIQVAHEETQTGSSSSSITVTTSASLTGAGGQLYLAAIAMKNKIAVLGVSGLGLSWMPVRAQCSGRNNTGVEVWMAQGTPSGNGTVTATFASKPGYAVIAVSRYSGVAAVNPIGSVIAGNTNGVDGACAGGADNKSYSFNLIPQSGTSGAMVYGAAAMRDRSHTPGAGYTERADIRKNSASVAVQDKSVTAAGAVILNGTFSGSVDWAVVGLEIKPSSGGSSTQYTLATNVVGSGSVSPSGGTYAAGAGVTLTATPSAGYQFSGWSGDLSGSENPATITMDGNKNVTATFAALPPNQYTLTANTSGAGSVSLNPSGGTYDAGTVVTLTANPAAGFQFSGWSGGLSGSTNPATITMNANKSVTATFTAISGSGQVVFEEAQTGGSSNSTTVTTAANLTAVSGHLYLAAVAKKANVAVTGVSGLGLNWTLVKAQCAGRNQTGVEIWMAQGMPSGNGAVTATLASAPSNAAIAVSRYSGVDAANPLGNMISGNTVGANGACSGGVDNNAYSFNLTTAVNGAMIFSVAAMRDKAHTPGAGYTERAEVLQGSSTGSKASVAVQDQSVASAGTMAVNGTFGSSVDWAVAAVEIKPQLSTSKRRAAATNEKAAPPATFGLEPNYPNPFNPSTTIDFSLPAASNVMLSVYDETGRLVRVLATGEMPAGRYSVQWHGNDNFNRAVATGMYLYKLEVEDEDGNHLFTQTRRMIFLK